MTERNKFTPKQEEWLQALESGEWQQTDEYLCRDGAYCCLGVATKLSAPNSIKLKDRSDLPSKAIWNGLRLRDQQGGFCCEAPLLMRASFLTDANDNGATFEEIAAYIRKYPWAVFTNFDVPAEVPA